MMDSQYALPRLSELLSPGLLIYRSLVRQNLQTMIAMARGAERLRPHVKTHKMAEIVRMAESMGIRKHKCATIAEAEMVAAAGGTDVLVSYPLVGPNLKRFANLVRGLSQHDLPRDRGSSRLGPGPLGRRGRARPAGSRPRRPGDRHGPDRHRSGRGGRRALRAGGPAAQPRRRRPARLRRPDPRHATSQNAEDEHPGRASSGPWRCAIGC